MFGFFSFYSILISLLAFFYIPLSTNRDTKKQDHYFYLASIVLFFFAAFRAETVGGDLESYLPLFQESKYDSSLSEIYNSSLVYGYEIGFLVLCRLINFISTDGRAFIFITTLLSLIGPFLIVKNYSSNKTYSLFLYVLLGFYTFSMNSIRNAIAVSIVMIAISFLLNNKKSLYFIFILVATTIHTSAIVSVLLFPLVNWHFSLKKILVFIVLLLGFFFILGPYLFSYLLSNVFTQYLDKSGDVYSLSGTGYSLLAVVAFVATICLLIYQNVSKEFDETSQRLNTFFLLSVLLSVLMQAFSTYMAALTRLTNYFYVQVIVLLPTLISNIRNVGIRRLVYVAMFVFFLFIACITFLAPVGDSKVNSSDTIPYVFLNGLFSW